LLSDEQAPMTSERLRAAKEAARIRRIEEVPFKG
jgi:hypothetical protein